MKAIAYIANVLLTVLAEFCMYSRSFTVGVFTAEHQLMDKSQRHGIYHYYEDGISKMAYFQIDRPGLLTLPSTFTLQSLFEQGIRLGMNVSHIEVFSGKERRMYQRNDFTPLSVFSL